MLCSLSIYLDTQCKSVRDQPLIQKGINHLMLVAKEFIAEDNCSG